MSKKKRSKQPKISKKTKPEEAELTTDYISKLSNVKLALVALGAAMVYFAFSFYSTGMYQGEEAVHYMNMKEFWEDSSKILGNWAKPGWKLIYVLPALGGYTFLHLFNSLISVLAGVLAYKICDQKGMKAPWLVLVLLFTQFFWFHLAFRNYSELLASTLVLGALYYNNKSKYLISALLVSYLLIIRQEWLPIIFFYGLFLLYKRQWVAAFSIALFPVLINIWGWTVSGDPLYYLNNALGTSKSYEHYPRHGFSHYFKVTLPILGPLTIAGVGAYIAAVLKGDEKPDYFIIFPTIGFFILLCILNIKDPSFGTSTAGNWRYLLVISPLFAILAALGFKSFYDSKNKVPYLISILLLLAIVFYASTFKHNFIVFLKDQNGDFTRDSVLMVAVGLTALAVILPLAKSKAYWLITLLGILFCVMYIRPKLMVGENKALKEFVPWSKQNKILDKPIVYLNPMLRFFWDKTPGQFENSAVRLTKESVENAEIGTYILWDSHYTERETGLTYKYFQDKPEKYKLIKQVMSDDKRFGLLIYEQIGK